VRVLVIDDQLPLVRTIRQALAPEGFTVDACYDSEEAFTRATTRPYDLILLSLLLPNDQGLLLLRRLRRSGVASAILALIGSGSVHERVRCLDVGADGYLTRPIHAAELVARARASVRRSGKEYDNLIRVFDLEIDTAARIVWRAGQFIHLTRREYDLLCFLARHRGQVCSRALICQHLYEEEAACKSNVVDVYIRFLRGKIDRGFDIPLITTCWGKGYMLRSDAVLALREPEAS
jgi:DNA-binding response OmpR family regulator